MRFRFIHAGDLHLDTPFVGVRRVPAPLAEVLRSAGFAEGYKGLTLGA